MSEEGDMAKSKKTKKTKRDPNDRDIKTSDSVRIGEK
jgi:hypothetical protein